MIRLIQLGSTQTAARHFRESAMEHSKEHAGNRPEYSISRRRHQHQQPIINIGDVGRNSPFQPSQNPLSTPREARLPNLRRQRHNANDKFGHSVHRVPPPRSYASSADPISSWRGAYNSSYEGEREAVAHSTPSHA